MVMNQASHYKASKATINRSYVYLLPMLALAHNLKLSELTGFQGCYLYHESCPDFKEHLFLHFKLTGSTRANTEIVEILSISKHLEFKETLPDQSVMFCMKIPAEYKREYHKFVASKYSEFSENYKQCIIRFHSLHSDAGGRDNKKSVINVLYKNEEGYKAKEKYINEGLPEREWTRIPRGQEIGALLEEIKDNETFKLSETYE